MKVTVFSFKMSHSTIIKAFRSVIPPLVHSAHKGTNGRVGVIGGSLEYTGAPYFAAISALKTGADLVHVFCHSAAAPVIKAYSPELIVHPVLDSGNAKDQILEWSQRLHVLIVGPGLGRDPATLETVLSVLRLLKNIPVVVDADGIFLLTETVSNNWEEFLSSRNYIITPNAVELSRLQSSFPRLLPAVFLMKGEVDKIRSGSEEIICDEPGSARRCGGQGDVLSGITGIFAAWASLKDQKLTPQAAAAASMLTRRCSRLAFEKYKRAMVAGNLIEFIGPAFESLFGDV